MKKIYLVSRTYSETTPESCEDGAYSDTGFVFEPTLIDLAEVLDELRYCCELSRYPANRANIVGTWASTSFTIDYRTGTERQESVHIKTTPARLFRIYKLAGLIK